MNEQGKPKKPKAKPKSPTKGKGKKKGKAKKSAKKKQKIKPTGMFLLYYFKIYALGAK